MPFIVESKGEGKGKRFLVINRETQRQTGHFVKKDEAVNHAEELNERDKNYRPNAEVFIGGK